MTYKQLVRRAWIYNQANHLGAIAIFGVICAVMLIVAVVCVASGHGIISSMAAVIFCWAGYRTCAVPDAKTRQEALVYYINRLLTKAAQKKLILLEEEDEKVDAGISMFEHKKHRIMRNYQSLLERDVKDSLQEVAEELRACKATLERLHVRKKAATTEISGFSFELDVLKEKVEKAVYNHYSSKNNADGESLAAFLEGLRKNASEL